MNTCEPCGEQKPPEAFRLRKSMGTGGHYRGRVCKACHTAKAIEWKRRNPDKVRVANQKQRSKPGARETASQSALERHYRRRFGITLAERDAMFVAQGGECKICQRVTPTKRGWCVDHNHKTGRIRGVLCAPCNTMLGHARDKVTTLRRGADYLEEANV